MKAICRSRRLSVLPFAALPVEATVARAGCRGATPAAHRSTHIGFGSGHRSKPPPWPGRKRHRALCWRLSGSGWRGRLGKRAFSDGISHRGHRVHREILPFTIDETVPPLRRGEGGLAQRRRGGIGNAETSNLHAATASDRRQQITFKTPRRRYGSGHGPIHSHGQVEKATAPSASPAGGSPGKRLPFRPGFRYSMVSRSRRLKPA